ncbi:MAG: hypothetical protein J6A19_08210 [Oscillospiraceae bacterium]|nr:hypothetical protein [Oscillospiraceae bacterium]
MLLSAAGTEGSQITLPEEGVRLSMEAIWTAITTVVGNFLTDVVTPVTTFVTTNPIALTFLGVSFVGTGIKYLKRALLGSFVSMIQTRSREVLQRVLLFRFLLISRILILSFRKLCASFTYS